MDSQDYTLLKSIGDSLDKPSPGRPRGRGRGRGRGSTSLTNVEHHGKNQVCFFLPSYICTSSI
jgi:hypothetical protein